MYNPITTLLNTNASSSILLNISNAFFQTLTQTLTQNENENENKASNKASKKKEQTK